MRSDSVYLSHNTSIYLTYLLIGILQSRKMKWPKRCKACLTKPDTRPRAVQQPAMMGAVLETTARLTQAATVMRSATTSATAVTISQQLTATVSTL